MNNLLRYATSIIFLLSISGCTTRMDVDRYSISPPGAELDKKQRIVVRHSKEGGWNSAHYLESVVRKFNQLGYDAVADKKGKNGKYPYGRYIAFYKFENDKETYSYEYKSNTYGMKNSGRSTINCDSYGDSVSCTETESKVFGVTGQETRTATKDITYRTFYLWIYDLDQKDSEGNLEHIIYSSSMTSDDHCSEKYIYNQLIEVAISTMKTGPQSEGEVKVDTSDCPRS